VEDLRARREEIEVLPVAERSGLDLVEEYPDHPEAESALDELLNEPLPLWALPPRIRRTRSAVEDYRDYLGKKKSEKRLRELNRRAGFFEWHDNTLVSAPVSILGVLVLFLGIFGEGTLLGILVGVGIFAAGVGVQYLGATEKSIGKEKGSSGNVHGSERVRRRWY